MLATIAMVLVMLSLGLLVGSFIWPQVPWQAPTLFLCVACLIAFYGHA